MTTYEFTQFVAENMVQQPSPLPEKSAAIEIAHLISGSLIYRLYASMIANEYDMDMTTEYLNMLHSQDNHFGLLFYIFMLCDATNTELPERFTEAVTNPFLAPFLSDAMLADWIDFHDAYED